MRTLVPVLIAAAVIALSPIASDAKKSAGSSNSYSSPSYRYSPGPGTGSNPNSNAVRGYNKRDGTYVAPHRRTDQNPRFDDNYSTKPNNNPWTGETGTRVTPPRQK